jgi:hypothetical protein
VPQNSELFRGNRLQSREIGLTDGKPEVFDFVDISSNLWLGFVILEVVWDQFCIFTGSSQLFFVIPGLEL